MKRRRLALLLPTLVLALTGCVLLDVLAYPFKLLFGLFGAIGDGASSLAGAAATVEPVEEGDEVPVLTRTADGRFLVSAPATPKPFRIRVRAEGHEERVLAWPGDFAHAGAVRPDGAVPEVRILLVASQAR